MSKKVRDHLGNEYPSIADMCRHYNVNECVYRNRIRYGWTVEEALCVNPSKDKGCVRSIAIVFRGEKFLSIKDLCDRYGIPRRTLARHIKKEGSVEAAAEKILENKRIVRDHFGNEIVKDHLGNEYPSISEMCKHYSVHLETYRSRIRLGWTPEEALTGKTVKDHLGNEYPSVPYMCIHYGIDYSIYRNRIRRGWTLEEALTGKAKTVKDHLGNEYPSIADMCRRYEVEPSTYHARIKYGWTVEEALLGKKKKRRNVDGLRIDHLGNEYRNTKQMCEAYHISVTLFCERIKEGFSLEKALTNKED